MRCQRLPPQASRINSRPGHRKIGGPGGGGAGQNLKRSRGISKKEGRRPPFDCPTLSHSCGHRTSPPSSQEVFPSTTRTEIPRGRHREPTLPEAPETDPREAANYEHRTPRHRQPRRRCRPESESARRAWRPDPAAGLHTSLGQLRFPPPGRVLRSTESGSRPLLSRRARGGPGRRHRHVSGHSQARARG